MRQHRRSLAIATTFTTLAGSLLAVSAISAGSASAESTPTETFEAFTLGTNLTQNGWQRTGSYDSEIVAGTGVDGFGDQSLRISNSTTSGSFGDHLFSNSLAQEAGETGAVNGGLSSGPRQPHFEAEWSFTSADPSGEQAGLAVGVSADRGDGARMSQLRMVDGPDGLGLVYFDYQDRHHVGTDSNLGQGCTVGTDGFFPTTIVSGLPRNAVYTVKMSIDFLEGPRNDVLRIWVDGSLVHVDTTWEDYYRYCAESQPPVNVSRTVDSLLFRPVSPAAGTPGSGFLVDNVSLASGPIPTADATGSWFLDPEQQTTVSTESEEVTSYRSKVRPPINADGSSNFPARRGVIPVQFDLEKSTRTVTTETTVVEPVVFESIFSDNVPPLGDPGFVSQPNDSSFLSFTPDDPKPFADLETLIADYDYTQGDCGGGSLRWSVRLDVGNDGVTTNDRSIWIYYGDVPNFTSCDDLFSQSGDNLIGNSDARFDSSQLSGPLYGTYAQTVSLYGDLNVVRASLVVDGGWTGGDDKVELSGAEVDGATWTPELDGTFEDVTIGDATPFAKTCDLPDAKFSWAKGVAAPSGPVNEETSIQNKDTGLFYRKVDCKYIYNLDVSSLDPSLATRPGIYRVWVNIGGTNIADPARFDLR